MIPLGLLIILFGVLWAVKSSEIKLQDLQLWPVLTLLFVFPFISVVYGVFGLKILASMAPNKPTIEFWEAFKINALAEISQVLPIPAASAVRAGALTEKGVNIGYSTGLVVFSALTWLSLALFFAGVGIVYSGNVQGFIAVAFGLLVFLPAIIWMLKSVGAKTTSVFIAHKILGLFITAARILVSFATLGVILSFSSSFVFSLAVITGSTIAITPAGLGVSEILGTLLSTMTNVDPAIAFLAIAVDRLVSIIGFAFIAFSTILTSGSNALSNKE